MLLNVTTEYPVVSKLLDYIDSGTLIVPTQNESIEVLSQPIELLLIGCPVYPLYTKVTLDASYIPLNNIVFLNAIVAFMGGLELVSPFDEYNGVSYETMPASYRRKFMGSCITMYSFECWNEDGLAEQMMRRLKIE